ncbi:MAG: hypothetical protein AAF719_08505 [Pseudomonadota bacterium]
MSVASPGGKAKLQLQGDMSRGEYVSDRSFGRKLAISSTALATALLSGCGTVSNAFESTPNVGPCPVTAALYDASRLVEIVGDREVYNNVGFTGEVSSVQGYCRYVDDDPITMELDIDFAFGRGPAAAGDEHTYQYFVAVTRRDLVVIEKEVFDIDVEFRDGADRAAVRERIDRITIPRANAGISGVNFEILVGFELTDAQLDFNRQGKRFRVNAGG